MRRERREVVGVVIHVVSVADLAGAPVTAPVMGDDAIAMIDEEHHLRVPVVARKRPPVRKNDRLPAAAAPILVVNLYAVFGRDRAHGVISFLRVRGMTACAGTSAMPTVGARTWKVPGSRKHEARNPK